MARHLAVTLNLARLTVCEVINQTPVMEGCLAVRTPKQVLDPLDLLPAAEAFPSVSA
jgi:hypothetical protein